MNRMKPMILVLMIALVLVPFSTSASAGLLYTNLVDQGAQSEVKRILADSGIPADYVDDVFSWIDTYNAGVAGLDTFELAPGFTQTDKDFVWYGSDDEYPSVSNRWWKVNKYGYTDVLCRSVAYYLLRDYISVQNVIPQSEWHVVFDENDWSKSWLVTDMDCIRTNPNPAFTDAEIGQYFSLYNPVALPEGASEQDMYAAVKREWDARGVSFQDGAVSLITVWTQQMGLTAAGHAAVLAEYEDGLLLFEKTNPEYPYQATKFTTIDDVKAYMIAQFNSTYEDGAGTLMVMQNGGLLE